MDTTGKQVAQSAVYSSPEDAIRALELLLYEMRSGRRDPEVVKKEVEAAGEAYGRVVNYCIDVDDVDAARRICRVMGITDKTPAGSKVVEFLQEKARVLTWAECAGNPRPPRFGNCYECIIRASSRLYSWLYDRHREVLTGEAAPQMPGRQKGQRAPELQEEKARQILDKAIKAGIIKDDYSPTDKLRTKTLRAYFAVKFSKAMGWEDAFGKPQPRYAPFERLWGDKGLGAIMYNKRAYNGKAQGANVLDAFFTNLKH